MTRNDYDQMRKHEDFINWANRFIPDLVRLHQVGFKGYLIKNDGTIETVMHDWAKVQIDMIHDYIESKKPDFTVS